jgi:hypothetical protein
MIDLIGFRAVRSQLAMNTLMLLIAISAPCFALYAFSGNFAPVRRSGSVSAGITAALAWSLAAALPALWVGAALRTPPSGVLIRFGIGNGIFATLLGAKMSALLFVTLLGVAVVVPSLGWYIWSQMTPGAERDRIRGYLTEFFSYVVQFVWTFLMLIAATALLERIL